MARRWSLEIAHFCSMCGPKFRSMEIAQQVRHHAAKLRLLIGRRVVEADRRLAPPGNSHKQVCRWMGLGRRRCSRRLERPTSAARRAIRRPAACFQAAGRRRIAPGLPRSLASAKAARAKSAPNPSRRICQALVRPSTTPGRHRRSPLRWSGPCATQLVPRCSTPEHRAQEVTGTSRSVAAQVAASAERPRGPRAEWQE